MRAVIAGHVLAHDHAAPLPREADKGAIVLIGLDPNPARIEIDTAHLATAMLLHTQQGRPHRDQVAIRCVAHMKKHHGNQS